MIKYKICHTCKVEKRGIDFYSNKSRSNGLYDSCKDCVKKKIIYPKTKGIDLYAHLDLKEEIWRKIIINNIISAYEISNYGRVRFLNGKIAKPSLNQRGYSQIVLTICGERHGCRIHRLVGEAFIRNKFNLREINHKDGDKLNNHVSNLEWMSSEENSKHAYENNLRKPFTSENHPRAIKILNMETKEVYPSVCMAAKSNNICSAFLKKKIKEGIIFSYYI